MPITPWSELDAEERADWDLLLSDPLPPPTPALEAWRRRRDTTTRDRLWRAACWEQAAFLAWAEERYDHMADCLARARQCMLGAA